MECAVASHGVCDDVPSYTRRDDIRWDSPMGFAMANLMGFFMGFPMANPMGLAMA